ncbi:MAG TPA: hypothetical protein VIM70_08005 [Clostridium sp.]|uniref:hypothetical protein n=1 Tax=Clostridium sp. TaxID=1506 RepID=UPI002F944334
MENTNDIKLEDDFNCEGGIWRKSTSYSMDKEKYDFINENGEEESYCEPYFEYEREIPDDY